MNRLLSEPPGSRSVFVRYGFALAATLAALLLTVSISPLEEKSPFLLFVAAVMLAAWYGGLGPGLIASSFAIVASIYLVLPGGGPPLLGLADYTRLAVFVLVAVVVGSLTVARKQAEEATAAQREYLRVALDSIGDAVLATDGQGRVTFMNQVAERLTGWGQLDARNQELSQVLNLLNEHTREQAPNPVARVLETGKVVGLANHTILVRRDGKEIPIDDSAAPIRDAQGNLIGMIMVFRDITERRQAEQALKLSEERYSSLFHKMLDAFALHRIVIDDEGRPIDYVFIEINDAFARLTGLKREQVIGRRVTAVLPGIERDPADWIGAYGRVALTGEETRFEQYSEALGKWYSVYAYSPQHGYFAVHSTDITEARRAERERAELLEREHAARQEAEAAVKIRDQFISLASHELRTPLTSTLGYAQLLHQRIREGQPMGEAEQRMIATIEQQTVRLNKMIAELLDISRIEKGQLVIERKSVELTKVITRVIDDMRPATHRHTIEFLNRAGPITVKGDELRLEEVLHNLMQNAVKYSPWGGPIMVELARDGNMARIAVSDRGLGIPASELGRLFRRFYRAPNAEAHHITGLGIGLYVVREIVRLHGGHVEVESEEGSGSTFSICLPLENQAR